MERHMNLSQKMRASTIHRHYDKINSSRIIKGSEINPKDRSDKGNDSVLQLVFDQSARFGQHQDAS